MGRRNTDAEDGLYRRDRSPFWWLSYQSASGRQTRRSSGIPIEQDPQGLKAKALRAQLIAELGSHPPPTDPRRGHTFDELLLAYMEEVTPTKRDPTRDRYIAKHLQPVFTGQAMADIGIAEVRAYIKARQAQGVAAGTINKEIGLMSAAITWAQRELEWDLANPWRSRFLREPPGRTRWLTLEEADRLLTAARQGRSQAYMPAFILLCLHTGLRRDEALELEWSRVDLGRNRLFLGALDQKGKHTSEIPINALAREALLQRANFRATHCPDSPWVFAHESGKRITGIYRGFKAACAKAGITDCHPHDLRRTCGSWLIQGGTDVARVARILRHADVRVTARVYAHLRTEDLEDDLAALAERLAPGNASHKRITLAQPTTATPGSEEIAA